jgi:hypothetical protein
MQEKMKSQQTATGSLAVIITMIVLSVGLAIFYWQYDETRKYNDARAHLEQTLNEAKLKLEILEQK